MTPEQYARDKYPDATDAMIKFFLKGYEYSLIMNDFETLWDNLPSFEKREFAEDFLDGEYEDNGYDDIEDAWQDLNEDKMMSFLKDKIKSLSIYELYCLINKRMYELIREHQLMTTI